MRTETGPKTTEARALDALERLVLEDERHTVESALAAVHALVGMDTAYLTELSDGRHQEIRALVGNGEPFGLHVGTLVPLDRTFCVRMLAGDLPSAIADTALDPVASTSFGTRSAGVRAYVGVPVRFSDGRIYGTLCCISATPHRLRGRHVRFMRVVARLIADRLEREHALTGAVSGGTASADPTDTMRLNLWFAAAPKAVVAARRALDALADQLSPETLHDARLLVTELIANSVEHAGIGPAQAVGLQAAVSPSGLHVEVSDPGPGFAADPLPDGGLEREGQWGLVLVDSLADRWGVERNGPTRVWFELGAGAAPSGPRPEAAAA